MRDFVLRRDTAESKVLVEIGLDEYKEMEIITPINFFTHMLHLFSFHGRFKLDVEAESRDNDPHHIIEDTAITMGMCLKNALLDKKGINRFGSSIIPMDDALVMTAIDLSGRPYSKCDFNFKHDKINDMPTDMFQHFFESFANNAFCTIHIKQLDGVNDHHIAEATFKSFAVSLAHACKMSDKFNNSMPSSKGVL